jgi:hypothetical protein
VVSGQNRPSKTEPASSGSGFLLKGHMGVC